MALNRKSVTPASSSDKANSNVEYENLAAGEHEGRLVYVADLGLQARNYKGEEKPPAQQISLGIEIVGNSVMVDGVERPRFMWTKPFNIYYQMDERGTEYKMYKIFNAGAMEGEVADWDSVLGEPCNVIVEQQQAKDGSRTYDNIKELTSIPAKYRDGVAEARITDMAVGDSEDDNNPAQRSMFGIAKYVHGRRLNAAKVPVKNNEVEASDDEDFDDVIPF